MRITGVEVGVDCLLCRFNTSSYAVLPIKSIKGYQKHSSEITLYAETYDTIYGFPIEKEQQLRSAILQKSKQELLSE